MLAAVSQLQCCRQSLLSGLLSGKKTNPFVRTRLIKQLFKFFKISFGENFRIRVAGSRIFLPETSLLELRSKYVERFLRTADASDSSKHCQIAFLQGMFIAHGYIQNPGRGYHLEFRLKGRWNIAAFKKTCRFLRIRFGCYSKDHYQVFYCKNSRKIIKILHRLGVFDKALELSDFIATRRLLSMVNRQVNSETANINRQITAAEKSILQIQQLVELPEQDFWTENLYDTALMRLKFPHDSIEKLGGRFEPNLTKSAVNHRLRRIKALYDRLLGRTENHEENSET